MLGLEIAAHRWYSCPKKVGRRNELEGRLRRVVIAGTVLAGAPGELAARPILPVVSSAPRR